MNKIVELSSLKKIFRQGEVVLITGSFDLLHLGHLRFFHNVKNCLPDDTKSLIIVLDDKNIKARKGDNRPVFNLAERIESLTYLTDVDYILAWKEPWEKLREFVKEYKPNYLAVVKGDPGFDNKKDIIESIGGKLIVVDKIDDFSTTKIIEKFGI